MSERVTSFRLIAAKGTHNGPFQLWYDVADGGSVPFVLTLTHRHVATALHKAGPLSLEEIEDYAFRNEARLRAIARLARAVGKNTEVLD